MVKKKKSQEEWEYVEVKSDDTPQTKAQKEFKEEVEKEGGEYTTKRMKSFWY